ncbi:hypothetical protein BCR44DRAFT_119491 [Catenaria anguillulae PL171]|uniref:Radical SAM core domain-containing protein n=1 Tax=Catenaria anguillulae PL171 TaxID=765915 RepID=A0A1Y2HQJ4_9FUNG|nr:hypothetical protein BCR44DRAFT_119491 [Catenaria anguillulae PL171]
MYRAAQRKAPLNSGAPSISRNENANNQFSESKDPCCCATSASFDDAGATSHPGARESQVLSSAPHLSRSAAENGGNQSATACGASTPCSSQVAHVQKVAFHLRDNPKHVLEVTASHIHTTTSTPAPGTPHTHSHSSVDNLHVSVATQIGCKHNCSYCVSSMLGGLRRNLGLEELVAQPLDNPDTLDFLAFLASPSYAHVFGPSAPPPRTSVSTVGILTPLEELVSEFPSTAVSWTLTSPFPDQRKLLMRSVESHSPMLRVLPLLHAARHRGHDAPIAMAYVLLDGVNDSDAHLDALARLAHSGPSALDAMPVSLIHFHPVLPVQDRKLAEESIKAVGPESKVPSLAKYAPSAEQVVDRWVRELDRKGVPVSKQQYFEFPAVHV